MTTTIPSIKDEAATIGVELYGKEHQTWLAENENRGPFRELGEPTIVRRRNGQICGLFGAVGTVEELDAVAARCAPTWTAFHVTPAVDGEPSMLEPTHEHRATAPAPGPYAEIAAELHRIADDLAAIAGPGKPTDLWVALNIQTKGDVDEDDATKIPILDRIATALLGCPCHTRAMSSGTWHHNAHGNRGLVQLGIYSSVTDPARRDKDAELERLPAENAAVREAAGGVAP